MEEQQKEDKYTIEDFSIKDEVLLLDTSNYNSDYSKNEEYPIKGIIKELTDYPTIWVKSIKTGNKYEVYPDQVSYKPLDQQDIESLGWESHSIMENNWYMETRSSTLYLYFQHTSNGIHITIDDDRMDKVLFSGYIKNKSELKVLMKQLGIHGK